MVIMRVEIRSATLIKPELGGQDAGSSLPRMTYTHLTEAERYQIGVLSKALHNQSASRPFLWNS